MLMIVRCISASAGPGAAAHRMRIVETKQALAFGAVLCQRIAQSVWSLRCRWHNMHVEFDPVVPRRIDDQHLTIEVEQGIETSVPVEHNCSYQIMITTASRFRLIGERQGTTNS